MKSLIQGAIIVFLILFISLSSFANSGSLSTNYYWNIEDVGIPEAWQYTNGSSEIIVAIIDSGVCIISRSAAIVSGHNLILRGFRVLGRVV